MTNSLYPSRLFASAIILCAAVTHMSLATTPEEINRNFAQEVYTYQSSILFVGDSTTQPRGSGYFVPYYEGMIQTLPNSMALCGFRVSGSSGNTGVNNYIRFSGGSTSSMVNGVRQESEEIKVGSTPHSPPGYRNEFQIAEGATLPSSGRFATVALTNLAGIYPAESNWIQGASLVIRTPFYISSDGSTLQRFSIASTTDHDGSAGISPSLFDTGSKTDVQLDHDRYGLQAVDTAPFVNPETSRIGVLFAGDLDTDDADEAGKTLAWADHILFRKDLADADRGLYFDSVSIGGYTAYDHSSGLDEEILDDYFSMAPRPFTFALIWIGQNMEFGEWNGSLLPVWGERIESIGNMVIRASIDSGAEVPVVPILITPPLTTGEYPSFRFTSMNFVLGKIAHRRGWGHIDLQSLVGDSMANIHPGYIVGQGAHPSQLGAEFLGNLLYDYLDCIRTDYNADGQKDFLDISAFLSAFQSHDSSADLMYDGSFDFLDISAFIQSLAETCSE